MMPTLSALAGLGRSLHIYYGDRRQRAALAAFYGGFVRPGHLAFDIGAHVGNRTRVLAGLGARVVAVEPQALFHRFLRLTLPRRTVTLERAAVGATAGALTLHVSRRHPTVTTGAADWIAEVRADPTFHRVRWDHAETVPVVTLDSLTARHGRPDFCKVDVEGMEDAVLAGLSQPLPRVAVEYLPAALDRARRCIARLAALGPYRFNAVVGEATAFAWSSWHAPEAAAEALPALAAQGFGDLYAFLPEAMTDTPGQSRPACPVGGTG